MEDNKYFLLPYTSSTSFGWFDKHPLYYKKRIENELEEEKKKYNKDGTQIHMYFLERKAFDKKYIFLDYVSPSTEQQKIFCHSYIESDDLIKAYKKAYAAGKKSDKKILEDATKLKDKYTDYIESVKVSFTEKIIIPSAMNGLLSALNNSIKEHTLANKLLNTEPKNGKAYNEKVILFEEKEGIKCKAKLDRFIIDKDKKEVTLVDLKTTSNIYNFEESINEYKYKRQLAFYWAAIFDFIKKEYKGIKFDDWEFKTYIVALQKFTAMPIVEVIYFDKNTLANEVPDIQRILHEIKWHQDNNKWEHRRSYYEKEGVDLRL